MPKTINNVFDLINNIAFDGQLSRDVAKIIFISTIYGMSKRNLAKSLSGSNIHASEAIKKINDYLCID